MKTSSFQCPYCESSVRAYPKARTCASHVCIEKHIEQKQLKRAKMFRDMELNPNRIASRKKSAAKQIKNGYDKQYRSRPEVKERMFIRRKTPKIISLWDPKKGCPITGKYKNKQYNEIEKEIVIDHFLPIALLQEIGMTEYAADPINLWWIDASINKSKKASVPHVFMKKYGFKESIVDDMQVKVYAVLSNLLKLAGASFDKKKEAYKVFDVDQIAAIIG